MAHYAEINSENIVVNVLVIADEDTQDENGNESEAIGQAFCEQCFGNDAPEGTRWVQTSYNTTDGRHPNNKPFRLNFARIGWVYDETKNAFYDPNVLPKWTIDNDGRHQPPTPKPDGDYYWDIETEDWEPIVHPEGYVPE